VTRPSVRQFFDRWVSPRRTATIADLQRGKDTGELRSGTEPDLLNDAIFGAIPLTRRFGEELVEHVIRGHRSRDTGVDGSESTSFENTLIESRPLLAGQSSPTERRVGQPSAAVQ
jgi:hypothetical protein